MKTLIIIPTYNESDNIGSLVAEVTAIYPQTHILIIDDGSPDGTGRIAEGIAQKNKNIYVIRRSKKMGLGSALKAGFQWAIARDFDYILQMDADFSHNPADMRQILEESESGAEFVIGSRYKDGLRVKGRSIFRTGLSYFANFYARTILGLHIYDLTSGFRCMQARMLKEIDLSRVFSAGFAFQIEMAYLCHKRGYCIKEVPIVFNEREKGSSKFSLRIIVEAFFSVLRLRFFSI